MLTKETVKHSVCLNSLNAFLDIIHLNVCHKIVYLVIRFQLLLDMEIVHILFRMHFI